MPKKSMTSAALPLSHPSIPPEVGPALARLGLAEPGGDVRLTPLTGGVASDIWRVTSSGRTFCVKRALDRLRVAANWEAPVERRRYEVAWFRIAGAIVPDAVPEILGEDEEAGLFALSWLDPDRYRLWKAMLRDGEARVKDAAAVGTVLARIHSGTADDQDVAASFPTDRIFHAIRLEPYLEAAARAHPDLAGPLDRLVSVTAQTKRALVHGDVSPKNIMIGPHGPVLLDAECAWYGDPAFDIAFCANHLLLKCLWRPAAARDFMRCFDALADSYLGGVDWERREEIDARAAHLLPGLFLARVDGKSPVEYITGDADRDRVRHVARALLRAPCERLQDVAAAWRKELAA
jgi:aminoglycoside phosphotransferase (APT) family kinase protein